MAKKALVCELDMSDDGAIGPSMRELNDLGCINVSAGFFGGGGGTIIGVHFVFQEALRPKVEELLRKWGYNTFSVEGSQLIAELWAYDRS